LPTCTKAIAVLLSFLACFVSTRAHGQPSADYRDLKNIKVENAITDAQKAMAVRDFRLLAVRGYTIEVPGVDKPLSSIKADFGIRIIEGTSDYMPRPEDQSLNIKAREYAYRYNRTILDYVEANRPDKALPDNGK
jgi:hypothetical protein